MIRRIRTRALPALLAISLLGMPLHAQQQPGAAQPGVGQPGAVQTTQLGTQDRDRGFNWGLLGLLGLLGLMGMRGRGTDQRHDTAAATRRV